MILKFTANVAVACLFGGCSALHSPNSDDVAAAGLNTNSPGPTALGARESDVGATDYLGLAESVITRLKLAMPASEKANPVLVGHLLDSVVSQLMDSQRNDDTTTPLPAEQTKKLTPAEAEEQHKMKKLTRAAVAQGERLRREGDKLAKKVGQRRSGTLKKSEKVKRAAADTLNQAIVVKRKAKSAERKAVTKEGKAEAKSEVAASRQVVGAVKKIAQQATVASKAPQARSATISALKQTLKTKRLASRAGKALIDSVDKSCACLSPDEAMSCSSETHAELLASKKAGTRCLEGRSALMPWSWCYTTLACKKRPHLQLAFGGKCKLREAWGDECVFKAGFVSQAKREKSQAEEAESRARDVVTSAKEAQSVARRAMKLAETDVEQKAAEAALKSATELEERGNQMMRRAKEIAAEVKKTPEKTRESVVKRELANKKATDALVKKMGGLFRDSMKALKVAAKLVPSSKAKSIDSQTAKVTKAFQTVAAKARGKAMGVVGTPLIGSEHLKMALQKAALRTAEALRYSLKVLPAGNVKLENQVTALVKRSEQLASQTKKEERTELIAKMHEEEVQARTKAILKEARGNAERAVKVSSKASQAANAAKEDMSSDAKKLQISPAAKARAQKVLAIDAMSAQRAKAVEAQAGKVAKAAERKSSIGLSSTSIADARRLRTKTEDLVAKADKLKRNDDKEKQQAQRVLENDKKVIHQKANDLKNKVEVLVSKAESSDREQTKQAKRSLASSKELGKLARGVSVPHDAELIAAAAMKERAKALVNKNAAEKIKKAAKKSAKGAVPDIVRLEALKSKIRHVEQRAAAGAAKAEQKRQEAQKLVAHKAAKKASTTIANLKSIADRTKTRMQVTKGLAEANIKVASRPSAHMLDDEAKTESIKRQATDESTTAQKLELEAKEISMDPSHASGKVRRLVQDGEVAVQHAEAKDHEAKRIEKRTVSTARKVLSAGNKKLRKVANKFALHAKKVNKRCSGKASNVQLAGKEKVIDATKTVTEHQETDTEHRLDEQLPNASSER
eukprot:TRINITY_DN73728_c0_g1_i1.p1 TRINITY_DN73728_c0_g1~~TRINITY_DN73728_c0_g1_i1.p1  ORF type:complete len:1028 (+),score=266.36 TRINITY_DN73728_c0_g1_i1:96-3179(+)